MSIYLLYFPNLSYLDQSKWQTLKIDAAQTQDANKQIPA